MVDDLVTRTRSMLQASKTPWPQIAAGARVSLRWLYLFEAGGSNFTLRTVQGLNAYLTGPSRKSSAPQSRTLASS
jgi:hypothetical protein